MERLTAALADRYRGERELGARPLPDPDLISLLVQSLNLLWIPYRDTRFPR